jgi:hypothetical protein
MWNVKIIMRRYEFESPQKSKVMIVEGSLGGDTMPVCKRLLCINLFLSCLSYFRYFFQLK